VKRTPRNTYAEALVGVMLRRQFVKTIVILFDAVSQKFAVLVVAPVAQDVVIVYVCVPVTGGIVVYTLSWYWKRSPFVGVT